MDPNSICRKSRHIGGKQHEICQKQPEIVREVANGARMSIQECQVQFAQRKWNCSTTHKRSLHKIMKLGRYQAFIIIIICYVTLLYCKNVFITTLNCLPREKLWYKTNAIFWNSGFFGKMSLQNWYLLLVNLPSRSGIRCNVWHNQQNRKKFPTVSWATP